jgi:hypothetical protein
VIVCLLVAFVLPVALVATALAVLFGGFGVGGGDEGPEVTEPVVLNLAVGGKCRAPRTRE